MVVSYKECLKNHAATIGGHALDGCGEFMSSPSSNPSDPRSLKCAVCGCHRNFHRRDPQDYSNPNFINYFYSPPAAPLPPPPALPYRGLSPSTSPSLSASPSPSPVSSPSSPPPVSHFPPPFHSSAPHMLLALGGGYSGPSEEHNRNFNSTMMRSENSAGKKRYRTRFTQEQKEKMCLFSEKLGWKMQKGDENLIQEFCNEVGVSRGVFKVWMHNNKNTFRKKSEMDIDNQTHKINGVNNGNCGAKEGGFDSDINNPHNDIHRNEGVGRQVLVDGNEQTPVGERAKQ